MDDYENKKVRRLRGRSDMAFDDNKIPPEKRGKKKCPDCNGQGGVYKKVWYYAQNINKFFPCDTCKLTGEVDDELPST